MAAPPNRLKEFRERKGWSQEELAFRSGVSTRTVSRIETGTAAGGRLVREAIANALARPVELLFPDQRRKVAS